MNKTIKKALFLFLFLVLGFSISCEDSLISDSEVLSNDSLETTETGAVINYNTFEQLTELQGLYDELVVSKRIGSDIDGNDTARTTTHYNLYDFTIDRNTVVQIQNGDITTYTMGVIRVDRATDYFENLIITDKGDGNP